MWSSKAFYVACECFNDVLKLSVCSSKVINYILQYMSIIICCSHIVFVERDIDAPSGSQWILFNRILSKLLFQHIFYISLFLFLLTFLLPYFNLNLALSTIIGEWFFC